MLQNKLRAIKVTARVGKKMSNKLPSFHSYFTHYVVNIPKINKLANNKKKDG